MRTTYLAARYSRRVELQTYAPLFEAVGLRVSARWLHGKHEQEAPDGEEDPAFLGACAIEDIVDIAAAHVFVLFTEHPDVGYMSGGRHVETGYALALGLRVVVIGPPENVFHHLPATWRVERHASLGEFLDAERATRYA